MKDLTEAIRQKNYNDYTCNCWLKISDIAKSLLSGMLKENPEELISAAQIMAAGGGSISNPKTSGAAQKKGRGGVLKGDGSDSKKKKKQEEKEEKEEESKPRLKVELSKFITDRINQVPITILVVGEPSSGKTTLIQYYYDDNYLEAINRRQGKSFTYSDNIEVKNTDHRRRQMQAYHNGSEQFWISNDIEIPTQNIVGALIVVDLARGDDVLATSAVWLKNKCDIEDPKVRFAPRGGDAKAVVNLSKGFPKNSVYEERRTVTGKGVVVDVITDFVMDLLEPQ